MSKNAYEIRLETLRMAKEMADSKYCLQQDIMYRMIDQAVEKREDIEKAIRAHAPLMYRPSDIIEKANELYQYVSEKQQETSLPKKYGYIHPKDDVSDDKKEEHNEFELALRFLGNELIAIKMAATNFSGKLIVWSILLLIFSFMVLEVFGLSAMFGYGMEE